MTLGGQYVVVDRGALEEVRRLRRAARKAKDIHTQALCAAMEVLVKGRCTPTVQQTIQYGNRLKKYGLWDGLEA